MSLKGISCSRAVGLLLLRAVVVAIPLVGPLLVLCASEAQGKNGSAATGTAKSNGEFVGSQVCAKCHAGIYRRFAQTSMGRSMSLVTPAFLEKTQSSAS